MTMSEEIKKNQKWLAIGLGLLEGEEGEGQEKESVFSKLPPLLPPLPIVKVDDGKSKSDDNNNNVNVIPISSFPPLSSFDVSIRYHAIIVHKKDTNRILKCLKRVTIHRPRLRVVFDLESTDVITTIGTTGTITTDDKLRLYRKIVLKSPAAIVGTTKNDDNFPSKEIQSQVRTLLDQLQNEQSTPTNDDKGNNAMNNIVIIGWTTHTISLGYQDWTADELLKRILPSSIEIPSSMEQIGHVAHLNLREEQLPYKYMIGKVLFDKNKSITTIVNKLGTIETQYRTFGMEVIAGNAEPNWSHVIVKEEGCIYHLDFQTVYWNSRLGREHQRIVKLIRNDHRMKIKSVVGTNDDSHNKQQRPQQKRPVIRTVVADLMAGIGPFAIPLTANTDDKVGSSSKSSSSSSSSSIRKDDNNDSSNKTKTNDKNKKKTSSNSANDNNDNGPGIVVYANDLNPESYKYLSINATKNRCHDSLLKKFNMDGRQFCHQLQDDGIVVHHFIMNLPKIAIEFLDAFRGYHVTNVNVQRQSTTNSSSIATSDSSNNNDHDQTDEFVSRPWIHVYCFASKDLIQARIEIWNRIEDALGCPLDEQTHQVTITEVRDVSPTKNMYCVTFRLPKGVQTVPRIKLTTTTTTTTVSEGNDITTKEEYDITTVDTTTASPDAKRSKLS